MNGDTVGGIFALVVILALVTMAAFETRSEMRDDQQKCVVALSHARAAVDTTDILLLKPSCADVLRGAR